MHKAPRIIILTMVLLAVGWGGFWLIASRTTERVLTGWLEDRQAEGWSVSYAGLDTSGFPNRLDTTITELSLTDPDTGIRWSAPVFQNLSLVYRPTHVIAVLPGRHTFATSAVTHHVESDRFRASVVFAPALELPIQRSTIELRDGVINSQAGDRTSTLGVSDAVLSMRETPGATGHVYDLSLRASGVRPDAALMQRLSRSGAFQDTLDQIEVQATIRFDAPWDRYALERARPQPREIALDQVTAQWGKLSLAASGTLTVNAEGQLQGALQIKAEQWRDMITVARASGALPQSLVGPVTRAGEILARASGDPTTFDTTLEYDRGRASLGPIPIGKAPVIRLP